MHSATSDSFLEPKVVGLTRFELVTPRLSSVCSNQLSYRPVMALRAAARAGRPGRALTPGPVQKPVLSKLDRRANPNPARIRSISIRPSAPSRRPRKPGNADLDPRTVL